MRIVKYFFVGGAAAVVDFVLFAALTSVVGMDWFWAGVVGFMLATAVNYVLSIRYVFQSGVHFAHRHHEVAAVFVVSLIGLGANQAILWACIDRAAINNLASKVIATGGVFFWNYYARRGFVFRARPPRTNL